MKIVTPQYYEQFRCLASDCPDTCCAGWEVVVDDETAARYEQLGGENAVLKARIAAAIGEDAGEMVFRAGPGGRCPFLNEGNLCDIQSALGEKGLCRTCRIYPRFVRDYGGVREMGLSLSCPEAARIVLSHRGKVALETRDDPSIPPSLNDLDAGRYFAVRQLRETLLRLAQATPLPVDERCALMLRLAKKGDKKLGKGKLDKIPALCERFGPHRIMDELKSCCRKCTEEEPLPYSLLPETLLTLSILRPAWKERLESAANGLELGQDICPLDPDFEQQLLTAFVYRYVLRAAEGGQVSALVKLCIFSFLSVRLLGQGLSEQALIDLAHLYSREVEHNEDNISALLSLFETDPQFSAKRLMRLLMQYYPQPLHNLSKASANIVTL